MIFRNCGKRATNKQRKLHKVLVFKPENAQKRQKREKMATVAHCFGLMPPTKAHPALK